MTNNKDYIKIRKDFFENTKIILLKSEENGDKYVNLLLRLYLISLKFDGDLMLNENIPYTEEMLSKITGYNKNFVHQAIEKYIEYGFMAIDEVMFMADLEDALYGRMD